MEVASSRPDQLPTLSAAKTSELSLLVRSPFCWRSGRCRQCNYDFLLQFAGDIEADHTDSGIVMDCVDRNREAPQLGDWRGELTTTTLKLSDVASGTGLSVGVKSEWRHQ